MADSATPTAPWQICSVLVVLFWALLSWFSVRDAWPPAESRILARFHGSKDVGTVEEHRYVHWMEGPGFRKYHLRIRVGAATFEDSVVVDYFRPGTAIGVRRHGGINRADHWLFYLSDLFVVSITLGVLWIGCGLMALFSAERLHGRLKKVVGTAGVSLALLGSLLLIPSAPLVFIIVAINLFRSIA